MHKCNTPAVPMPTWKQRKKEMRSDESSSTMFSGIIILKQNATNEGGFTLTQTGVRLKQQKERRKKKRSWGKLSQIAVKAHQQRICAEGGSQRGQVARTSGYMTSPPHSLPLLCALWNSSLSLRTRPHGIHGEGSWTRQVSCGQTKKLDIQFAKITILTKKTWTAAVKVRNLKLLGSQEKTKTEDCWHFLIISFY